MHKRNLLMNDRSGNSPLLIPRSLTLCSQGCPPGSVLGWLDDIAAHYSRSTSSAAYWICRARIVEDDSDDHVTVDIFEQACRHNAQVSPLLIVWQIDSHCFYSGM